LIFFNFNEAIFIEKYSGEDAEHEITQFLKLSQDQPDVILASSDVLANGAISALKQAGIAGTVLVSGQGGELFACKNIISDYQAMTIYKPVKKLAAMAAEIAVKLVNGEKITNIFPDKLYNGYSEIPAIMLDVITVDAANIKTTVVADGFISEADLNK
jgi:D-xylose transport system substrate-binding protein